MQSLKLMSVVGLVLFAISALSPQQLCSRGGPCSRIFLAQVFCWLKPFWLPFDRIFHQSVCVMAALPRSISKALSKLQESAKAWSELPDAERAAVARACRRQIATLDLSWVEDNMRCVGLNPSKPDHANTTGFDPFLFTAATVDRLDKIADRLEGKLQDLVKEPKRQLPDNGPSIYPMGDIGSAAPGCTLELWSAAKGPDSTEPSTCTGACVVLAAGNQNFLTAVDVIERVFLHKECVFLKHHPIRPFMVPAFAHILEPLTQKGAFAQCLDSDLNGAHKELIIHTSVSHIHMTGSGLTHDRIVGALKAAKREEVAFTSELGCITPWIVCPGVTNNGTWQESDLEHHASMLTGAFLSSCSMNCLSPKLLVLPSEQVWPQKKAFIEALRKRMAVVPIPPPYYPGAHQRYAAFEKEYKDAEKIDSPPSQPAGDALQEAVYPGQDFKPLQPLLVHVGVIGSPDCRKYALENEAFAPVLAIGTVDCESAKDFPLAAAKALNTHVFGNLSCTLICPDERDDSLDRAINLLDYGCVAVNMWSALGCSNALGVWGAAPGSYTRENPRSGCDFIGNAAGVPNVLKSVVVSPFVNKAIAGDKPIPLFVLDALLVLVSGRSMVVPRILGGLVRRLFGVVTRLFGC
ncbi:unnamed protein product [Polarella glacialis]|uniref:Aldehyde dehydrogenase domain-containing protein n=1 Tax=Polarella glacialis TaxID=89957 RepID=A0A813JI31_POLGL|nr:unnamed protein product [Polarella glacialis]